MKISHIRVYRKTLTHARARCARGRGNAITSGSSTIVAVDTDAGRRFAPGQPGPGVEPDCGSSGAQVAMYT